MRGLWEQLRQLRQNLGGRRLCRKEQQPRGRSQAKSPKPPPQNAGPEDAGGPFLLDLNEKNLSPLPQPSKDRKQSPEGKGIPQRSLCSFSEITSSIWLIQSVVCRPAVWASPGSLLTMQHLRSHLGPARANPPPTRRPGRCLDLQQGSSNKYASELPGGVVKTPMAGPHPQRF